jgi:hypothetical protein
VGGGIAFKAAALTAGAAIATGVGYEGTKRELLQKPRPAGAAAVVVKRTPHRAPAVQPAAFTKPRETRHDQKPFKRSVAAKHAHDLKPFKPAHARKPNPARGHANHAAARPPKAKHHGLAKGHAKLEHGKSGH